MREDQMINREEILQTANACQGTAEDLRVEVLKNHVLVDDAQNAEASEFVKKVKAVFKIIDDERTEITAPLREAEKWVNAQFKPVLARLSETEATLKKMIGAFAMKKQAEQRALAAAAAELAAKSVTREAFVEALAMTQAAAPQAVEGVSVRKVWKFEILDERLVPRELCSVDLGKVRQAVAAGARDIPGVRVYEDQVVAVRT